MRSKGADIRIIGLPLETVAAQVRHYIRSADLQLVTETSDPGGLMIRAAEKRDRYFPFRQAAGPPLIEWRLHRRIPGATRMETRFGLNPRFRRRFWLTMVTLAGFFSCFDFAGEAVATTACINPACPFWVRGVSLCLATVFLFACFGLARSGINSNLRNCRVIEGFCEDLKKRHAPFKEDVLRSDCLFPDSFLVLAFFLAGAVLIVIRDVLYRTAIDLNRPDIWMMGWIIGMLITLVILSYIHYGFKERLNFILLALVVLTPILIAYGLAYINLWFPSWISACQLLDMPGLPADPVRWIIQFHPDLATRAAFLLALANITVLSLAAMMLTGIPKLTARLLKQRKSVFLCAARTSVYRRALDFASFSAAFVPAVFLLWITMAAALYFCLHAALSIFESGLMGQNHLFVSRAGRVLFENLYLISSVFLPPSRFGNLSTMVTRVMAVIYSAPLVGIIFMVIRSRLPAWWGKIRLVRNLSNGRVPEAQHALIDRCRRTARENGIRKPWVVVTASDLPGLGTFYVGFPYFRSVLAVSRGCVKLTIDEMEGLIAHEVFHIKNHSFQWYLLNVLSDITLFGTGFLAILTNSYAHELAADDFAVKWIRAKRIPASEYIRALRIMALTASAATPAGSRWLALIPREPNTPPEPAETVPATLKHNGRLLLELYFGETILSYIHPPLEERIARIETMTDGRAGHRRYGEPSG